MADPTVTVRLDIIRAPLGGYTIRIVARSVDGNEWHFGKQEHAVYRTIEMAFAAAKKIRERMFKGKNVMISLRA